MDVWLHVAFHSNIGVFQNKSSGNARKYNYNQNKTKSLRFANRNQEKILKLTGAQKWIFLLKKRSLSLFIIQKKLKRRKSRLATSWVGLMTTMATRICCKGKLQVGTRLIYLNSKSASVEKMWYFMILVPFGTWFRLPKESTWAYFFMLISRRRRRPQSTSTKTKILSRKKCQSRKS